MLVKLADEKITPFVTTEWIVKKTCMLMKEFVTMRFVASLELHEKQSVFKYSDSLSIRLLR